MSARNPYGYASPEWYEWEARANGFDSVQEWLQHVKENAPKCPVCGTPKGFAMGTGDCGCEIDPE